MCSANQCQLVNKSIFLSIELGLREDVETPSNHQNLVIVLQYFNSADNEGMHNHIYDVLVSTMILTPPKHPCRSWYHILNMVTTIESLQSLKVVFMCGCNVKHWELFVLLSFFFLLALITQIFHYFQPISDRIAHTGCCQFECRCWAHDHLFSCLLMSWLYL